MEFKAKFTEITGSVTDWLNTQDWFLQLKQKWEELDVQSRMYLKFGAMGGSALIALIIILSSVWKVHSLKREIAEKTDLLNMIQSANDELHKLKESNASAGGGAASTGPWSEYLESQASTLGIDKQNFSVTADKPGPSSDQTKESLIDVSLKHASVRQIVRYVFNLETGSRPVKVRNLSIDTKNDTTGYMDATLAVSAFSLQQPK